MALIGNTIRLKAQYETFAGVLSDPAQIQLTITVRNTGQVLIVRSGSEITRESEGVYYYDYTIPDGIDNLMEEWYGILENSDIINRKEITRETVTEISSV
jgi:hypothetical protein